DSSLRCSGRHAAGVKREYGRACPRTVAAPATVSVEDVHHGHWVHPGKAGRPLKRPARKPALSRHLPGCGARPGLCFHSGDSRHRWRRGLRDLSFRQFKAIPHRRRGTGMNGITSILAAGTAAAALLVAQAQAQDLELDEIVVTPNRTGTEAAKTGSKVEKVDREKIEEQAKPLLTDYL